MTTERMIPSRREARADVELRMLTGTRNVDQIAASLFFSLITLTSIQGDCVIGAYETARHQQKVSSSLRMVCGCYTVFNEPKGRWTKGTW
jgi:hypothetical protein